MAGTLYIVATPIGNLEDLTFRALRVLKEVDLILAEDTRVTRKLLEHFSIPTPVTSYHEWTAPGKLRALIDQLAQGQNLALVTDAGTPAVSDPGAHFVAELVRSVGVDAKVVPIPGVSAVTALLSVSGLPADSFAFFGFPPHKKGRSSFWKEVAACPMTAVFYESPHRIEKAMAELKANLAPERKLVIGRELTKMFESVRRGTVAEAEELLKTEPIKGEYVIAVEGI
jgi:16S rRNA (cytidine1402-2'-O)-methyltransferase